MFALKNFGPKKKKRLIKMKLGTDTDSNMLNSMVMFICISCKLPIFYHGFSRSHNETDGEKVDLN